MMIMSGAYIKLVVEDTRTGKQIAVITDEMITTADDEIVVRLTPDAD